VDILYLLIPLSAVLILVIVAIFGWAIHAGQFDDVEREGERLLQGDESPASNTGSTPKVGTGPARDEP
jgi:cbb3-type cytochrome oxidase maturation protein